MRRKDNVNTELETWTRSIVGKPTTVGRSWWRWTRVLMRVFSKRRVSYIALEKMYSTFLLRWATLDLHQKKKLRMRKHWNYWMQIFPASKRHIWKTLVPTNKTGGVRHSRSVTRLFQLAEDCDFHKSKNMIFAGSSSHFRRPLRDIVWFMKCAESRGRSRLKLINSQTGNINALERETFYSF